ncbi:MAG TPA: gluconate 2-dehydrogenase subunit 3 family protein [Gemmatimonadaceae bacterium]|nr:gluconate 2-dehydrogenase subunit 3 family protein [Gemmatimonadaceae bacterium]
MKRAEDEKTRGREDEAHETDVRRRDVLKVLAAAPLAAVVTWSQNDIERAAESVARIADEQQFAPKFFNAQELRTVRVLVDDIIPSDPTSGSATAAKVPEFMDFILNDGGNNPRTQMRNGLTWLDQESQRRFAKVYADAAQADRNKILDDIAWPARATGAFTTPMSAGQQTPVAWFNTFRNLTASGYFSSRVGLKALNYTGNVFVREWKGASPAMLQKLGLSYDEWDKKYGRGY